MIPFVIDNDRHRLSDVLNCLLDESSGQPLDIATAYLSISGYRLIKDRLHRVGVLRLLIGSDPRTGSNIGLRPDDRKALQARPKGNLETGPFTPQTPILEEDCNTCDCNRLQAPIGRDRRYSGS